MKEWILIPALSVGLAVLASALTGTFTAGRVDARAGSDPQVEASLDQHVPAGYLGHVVLVCAALGAQVRVALAHGQEARALLRVALGLAPAAREAVGAVSAALAVLLAKVL